MAGNDGKSTFRPRSDIQYANAQAHRRENEGGLIPAVAPAGTPLVPTGFQERRWRQPILRPHLSRTSQHAAHRTSGHRRRQEIIWPGGGGVDATASPAAIAVVTSIDATTTTAGGSSSPVTVIVPATLPAVTTSPPGSSEWVFEDDFSAGLGRWSINRWRSQPEGGNPGAVGWLQDFGPSAALDNVAVPDDVQIFSNQLWVGAGSQNYGDTLLRADQPLNMPTQVGVIEVDLWIAEDDPLQGWSRLVVTLDPYSNPSNEDFNSSGPVPRYGFEVQFNRSQAVVGSEFETFPWVKVWDDYVETSYDGTGGVVIDTTPHTIVNVRVEFTATTIDIYADSLLWYSDTWTLPPELTSGFVYIGQHNHASLKYTPFPANVYAVFDAVRFQDSAVAALPETTTLREPDNVAALIADDPDVDFNGVSIGWYLPETITISSLPDPTTLDSATLVLSATVSGTLMTGSTRFEYTVNGGTLHSVQFPQWNGVDLDNTGATIWSIPLSLAELVTGNNSFLFDVDSITGITPYIGNVQIVYVESEVDPDGTALPDTIAVTTIIDAVVATRSETGAPASIVGVTSIDAATASAGSTAAPAAIVALVSIDAVTLSAGSTVIPASIAAPVAMDAVSASGTANATTSPATIIATALLDAVSASGTGAGTAAPATIAATAVLEAVAVQAGAATSPVTIVAVTGMDTVVLSTGSTVSPASILAAAGMDATTVAAGASATVTEIVALASLPAVTAAGGSAGTASPTAIAVVVTIDSPTLLTGGSASPDTLQVLAVVPAVFATGTGVIVPGYVVLTVAAPQAVMTVDAPRTVMTVDVARTVMTVERNA